MKKYRILDLDNTIANDEWRISRINWQKADPMERYHAYHSLSAFDKTGNEDLFRGVEERLLILTARPVLYYEITREWLGRNGIVYHSLVMRNNDDHTHSKDLKHKQVGWLNSLYGISTKDIVDAYDDRVDVVAMYKELGIAAKARSIHSTSAYERIAE